MLGLVIPLVTKYGIALEAHFCKMLLQHFGKMVYWGI
ncbi:hypothetical protein ACVNPZ_06295 [Staphylococcus aureus]